MCGVERSWVRLYGFKRPESILSHKPCVPSRDYHDDYTCQNLRKQVLTLGESAVVSVREDVEWEYPLTILRQCHLSEKRASIDEQEPGAQMSNHLINIYLSISLRVDVMRNQFQQFDSASNGTRRTGKLCKTSLMTTFGHRWPQKSVALWHVRADATYRALSNGTAVRRCH